MAEVLGPIVQTSTVTMLHSSPDNYPNSSSGQSQHQSSRLSQMSRSHLYNGHSGVVGYRGTSATPVAPYAFQSTPHLRQENRTSSAPVVPLSHQNVHGALAAHRGGGHSSSSASTVSSASSNPSVPGQQSKDDTALSNASRTSSRPEARPASMLNISTSVPDLTLSSAEPAVRPSQDRYRRSQRRVDGVTPSPAAQQGQEVQVGQAPTVSAPNVVDGRHVFRAPAPKARNAALHMRPGSADDTSTPRTMTSEQAKRYRRRSVGAFGDTAPVASAPPPLPAAPAATWAQVASMKPSSQASKAGTPLGRPIVFHERQNSAESLSSTSSATRPSSRPSSSRHSSPRQDTNVSAKTNAQSSPSAPRPDMKAASPAARALHDSSKRSTGRSPLSKPVDMEALNSGQPSLARESTDTDVVPALSPAAQQLAALSGKEAPGKGMKSRLRRAFSFGSAAELRKASVENSMSKKQEKEDAEQQAVDEAIAAKQEAAGIGNNIYSGQGNIFSGSTDNLSISSTASSASVMLRKMGKGMKKSTRSLKGLFRPKSVIGVPAADTAITQPSVAQVSLVTVEAERERVNVNADPHDHSGGGTGYPKLERNSLDAPAMGPPGSSHGSVSGNDAWQRRSIVGGDRERAEVLAAVKKGILKRPGTGSNSSSPVARPTPDFNLPAVPHVADTPNSSAPSTPQDDQAGPTIRLDTAHLDYFSNTRITGSTRSLPNTPQGGRGISFSPRIQFHEAWSPAEYDRRGDIATCNRLTPMLAQQIKEELNTFKMEMEVHEASKPHTHFF